MVFVELQVHHARVHAHNENSHAHGPYEYFQRILGGFYGPALNDLLERVIVFMDEVFSTPVLLSMLILCLTHRQEGSGLPATLSQLYSTAMSGALRATAGTIDPDAVPAALKVMVRIATANMLAHPVVRREFTSEHVVNALDAKGMEVWEKLAAGDGSMPLLKMLEEKTTSTPAIYQFRHLSFQEALFAKWLTDGEGAGEWAGWKDDAAAADASPSTTRRCEMLYVSEEVCAHRVEPHHAASIQAITPHLVGMLLPQQL